MTHQGLPRLILLFSGCAVLTGAIDSPSVAATKAAPCLRAAAADEGSLLAAEDERFNAQVRHDAAAIARAMADEVVYTHASGKVQNKGDYLRDIETGHAAYRSITVSDRTARISGDAGITHGVLHMVVGDNNLVSSYLAAYINRDGRWQLLFWQTSPGP